MTVYGGDFKGLLLELKKNCLKPRPGSFKQLLQLVPNAHLSNPPSKTIPLSLHSLLLRY